MKHSIIRLRFAVMLILLQLAAGTFIAYASGPAIQVKVESMEEMLDSWKDEIREEYPNVRFASTLQSYRETHKLMSQFALSSTLGSDKSVYALVPLKK